VGTSTPIERLQQIYDSTIESGLSHCGDLENLDYYSLFCKATANNQLYKLFSCNLTMFNFTFNGNNSVLIVFSIPVSLNSDTQQDNRHISERVMTILKLIEDCFSTVDYMNLKNVKEDKFTYLTVVKKIDNEE
jgi:hypothetical protein